jgi:hypothetical protein
MKVFIISVAFLAAVIGTGAHTAMASQLSRPGGGR